MSQYSFNLLPYQRFLRRYFNAFTPIDSILIYGTVGVGKTCAAIQIAEIFRRYAEVNSLTDSKIIIISNIVSRNNMITTLISDCAIFANLYVPIHISEGQITLTKDKMKQIMKQLKGYGYLFYSYQKFHNDVELGKISNIDNSLIIVDEAHNMLNKNEYALALMKIIDQSKRYRIVLLTGTPMYNSHIDIIDLVNLMFQRDQRLIKKELVNDKKITNEGLKLIQEKLMHHLIFVHPLKTTEEYPKRIDLGIVPSFLNYTKLILIEMSVLQKKEYFRAQGDIHKLKRIVNFAFESFKEKVANSNNEDRINELRQLSKYSTKYDECLTNILEVANGIDHIFIFSSYVKGVGILLFSEILRANGFIHYGEQIKNDTRHYLTGERYDEWRKKNVTNTFYPATFFVYHQDVPLETRMNALTIFNSLENYDTRLIKIILGSQLTKEALDLKRIKHVHILNNQENFSRTEQVIGRAIRFKSHADLPESQRYVKIYKYCSVLSNSERDNLSFEAKQYQNDENEAIEISRVEKSIKAISVYCERLDEGNCIKNKNGREIDDLLLYEFDFADAIDTLYKLFKKDRFASFKYIRSIIDKTISDEIIVHALNYLIENKIQLGSSLENVLHKSGNNYFVYSEDCKSLPPIHILEINESNISTITDITDLIQDRISIQKPVNIKAIIEELRKVVIQVCNQSPAKQRLIVATFLSKLSSSEKQKLLEWAIERYVTTLRKSNINLPSEVFAVLQYFKRHLIEKHSVEPDEYFLKSYNNSTVDLNKEFIGYVFHDHIRKYSETNGWRTFQLDEEVKYDKQPNEIENPFIIGYIDKNSSGEFIFKLRFVLKNIHDKRKAPRGFVCSQINNKDMLLKIIEKLGYELTSQQKKEMTISDLCETIELILRKKQIESNKKGLKIRYFYDYYHKYSYD